MRAGGRAWLLEAADGPVAAAAVSGGREWRPTATGAPTVTACREHARAEEETSHQIEAGRVESAHGAVRRSIGCTLVCLFVRQTVTYWPMVGNPVGAPKTTTPASYVSSAIVAADAVAAAAAEEEGVLVAAVAAGCSWAVDWLNRIPELTPCMCLFPPSTTRPVKFWVKTHSKWSAFATLLGCHTPRGRWQIAAMPPKGGSVICQSARAKKGGETTEIR
jgi:hypothetical protein